MHIICLALVDIFRFFTFKKKNLIKYYKIYINNKIFLIL